MAHANDEDANKYSCPVCLDIFEDPYIIPCGNNHVACYSCVKPLLVDRPPKCSMCRTIFDARKLSKHKNLKLEMKNTALPCPGCMEQIWVSEMRLHQANCEHIDRSIKLFEPVKETTQSVPRDLPNRSTFHCPYCKLPNLDAGDLRKHCNAKHKGNNDAVVCPVCASMPWGSKDMKSSNFMQHLNHRHKFEYDTYVDYGQDDDAMLQAALQASLENS